MGCLKLTYCQIPELTLVYSKKELTLKNSSESACRNYPFGMTMAGLSFNHGDNPNMYNSKELQAQMQWYDFGWRMQDPQLGVWHCIDPFAESFYSLSPYNYVNSNPINNIDPDGRFMIDDFLNNKYYNGEPLPVIDGPGGGYFTSGNAESYIKSGEGKYKYNWGKGQYEDGNGNYVSYWEVHQNYIIPNSSPGDYSLYIFQGMGSWNDDESAIYVNSDGNVSVFREFVFQFVTGFNTAQAQNDITMGDVWNAFKSTFKQTTKEEVTVFNNVGWYGELKIKSFSSKTTGSGNIRATTTNGGIPTISAEAAVMIDIIKASMSSNLGVSAGINIDNIAISSGGVSLTDGFNGTFGIAGSDGAIHGYSFNLKPSPQLSVAIAVAGALFGLPTYLLAF